MAKSSDHDAYYVYPGDSLDYHTIGINVAAAIDTMSLQTRTITPQSSQSSQTGSLKYVFLLMNPDSVSGIRRLLSYRSDKQIRSCPICEDKQFTGSYAQRNLARHLETKHSTSPDGVKTVSCTYPGCQSTFKRGDARLIHERRVHPDSNTPQAKKRKRNGEE